jgi:Family of unknown function (DUF6535)/WW domain
MYQGMTEEDDKQRAKRWLKDADGILVFVRTSVSFIFHTASRIGSILQTGLLTVAVVTLLTVTIPNLRQDPQETTAFYLTQLFQLQLSAYENRSIPFIPDQPPTSSPVVFIIANTFLVICLSLNLFAAMLALLLQQWTRQYLMLTHSPQSNSDVRARVREVFGGRPPQNSPISSAVRISMNSLLLSVLMFFFALALYLFHFHLSVITCFYICSVGCFLTYVYIKRMPRRALDLSFIASMLSLQVVPDKPFWKSTYKHKIDNGILNRLFGALSGDSELVRFLEGIPDFCRSSLVDDPQQKIIEIGKEKLNMAVKDLMERTWSFNSLSDPEKIRRVVACVGLADAVRLSGVASSILEIIFPRDHHQLLHSVQMGRSLRNQRIGTQEKIGLCAQSLVAGVISKVQPGDHRWISLAAVHLGKSEDVIRGYIKHGQGNLLLANLTHITRQIFESSPEDRDMVDASLFILPTLSNFDIENILPGLQHDFLALWDKIDREASNDRVLTIIRNDLDFLRQVLTPLPPGWHWQARHTPQGRIYYVDYNTRSTSGTHPTTINDDLPPGWEARRTQDGHIFYVDHNTRSTTWIFPTSNINILPPGWEVQRTPDGRIFYVDHITCSTTWTRPPYRPSHTPPLTPQVSQQPEAPDRIVTDNVYDFSSQRSPTASASSSSHLDAERLRRESDDRRSQAGTSQAMVVASDATATAVVNTADSSGEHPTVRLDPTTSGVLPASSTHFPTNLNVSMAPSASASSSPLGARHDSGEPDDSIEMRSTDPSAENRDPPDDSA